MRSKSMCRAAGAGGAMRVSPVQRAEELSAPKPSSAEGLIDALSLYPGNTPEQSRAEFQLLESRHRTQQ